MGTIERFTADARIAAQPVVIVAMGGSPKAAALRGRSRAPAVQTGVLVQRAAAALPRRALHRIFAQSVKLEPGRVNTFTESISELKRSIVGNLFASLSFTLRDNSHVPEATEKTDTFTAVNLSCAFGGRWIGHNASCGRGAPAPE